MVLIAGVAIAWMIVSNKKRGKNKEVVYVCTQCGEQDCICHEDGPKNADG